MFAVRRDMKAAFVIVHPHEWFRFEPVRRSMVNAVYLLIGLPGIDHRARAAELLRHLELPYVDFADADLNDFDVFIEAFPLEIRSLYPPTAAVVRMMYGYANKNNTTYSESNAAYDMILTFGPYASAHLLPFAPVAEVGNPRFDDFAAQLVTSHGNGSSPASRDTIVYLPTVTYTKRLNLDFSTVRAYLPCIHELSRKYKIIVKLHPDVIIHDPSLCDELKNIDGVELVDPWTDSVPLISRASVVLSDASGVIFEAMAFGIPVVLCGGSDCTPLLNECFVSLDPAEDQTLYNSLGIVNRNPADLERDVLQALKRVSVPHPLLDVFYNRNLLDDKAGRRAAHALEEVAREKPHRTHLQRHLRRLYSSRSGAHLYAVRTALGVRRWDLLGNISQGAEGDVAVPPLTWRGLAREILETVTRRQDTSLALSNFRAVCGKGVKEIVEHFISLRWPPMPLWRVLSKCVPLPKATKPKMESDFKGEVARRG